MSDPLLQAGAQAIVRLIETGQGRIHHFARSRKDEKTGEAKQSIETTTRIILVAPESDLQLVVDAFGSTIIPLNRDKYPHQVFPCVILSGGRARKAAEACLPIAKGRTYLLFDILTTSLEVKAIPYRGFSKENARTRITCMRALDSLRRHGTLDDLTDEERGILLLECPTSMRHNGYDPEFPQGAHTVSPDTSVAA